MKLCFIDVETTGLNPKKNGIIQIAGIIEVNDIQMMDFNFFVKPFDSDIIDENSLKINNINMERIQNFHEPLEVNNKLIHIFSQYIDKYDKTDKFIFVGYNAEFDFHFLREWFYKNGNKYFFSWFVGPPLDVMNLVLFDLKDRIYQVENLRLETITKFYDIKIKESHNAYYDIKATYNLYHIINNKFNISL